ncbi:transposase [Streptomyces sp. DG2A-72]|nr:transposase [Streptomyces sp. DG2A-72]MDO0939011.1 transposase [Streptomyces sp. DG2A-72]
MGWRLFVPESWDPASPKAEATKVARRTRCGIPAEVGHVEKRQLALDMTDETRSWGIDVPLVVARPPPSRKRHGRTPRPTQVAAQGPSPFVPSRPDGEEAGHRGRHTGGPGRCSGGKPPVRAAAAAGSSACTHGSWPCGSGPPDARSTRPQADPNCRCAGCRPNGPPPSPHPSSSGRPTCPPTRRWPPSCAPRKPRWCIVHDYREMNRSGPGPLRRPDLAMPLPSRTRTAVTPRALDRRLPHLSTRHARRATAPRHGHGR